MGASLTTSPEQIAFSLNEAKVVITSNDHIAVAGVKAICTITFLTNVVPGYFFFLKWDNTTLKLTAASDPDTSGNQFPYGDGLELHVRAVMAAFESNYYIDKDFTLSYALTGGKPSIILTAKTEGRKFNVSNSVDSTLNVNLSIEGVTQELKANFGHHLEVWIEDQSGYINIYDNNLQLDPNSAITTKDISGILHPYLILASDRPALNNITWTKCINTFKSYYLKIGQYFGDQPTVKKVFKSPIRFINAGGLDLRTASTRNLTSYLRPDNTNYKTLCLRQGSKVKAIQLDQPEFLYWINLTGADINIRLRIDIYYTDGDKNNFSLSPITAEAWRKYYIGVGYNALNINSKLLSGKSCAYYTATVITEAGNLLSVPYTYFIDKYREWPRFIIYRNSLGGYSTLYMWGKGERENSFQKDVYKKQASQSETASFGNEIETNIRIQPKTTVNTGFLSRRDVANLSDFFLSEEKYLVENGEYIPIKATSDTFKESEDGQNIHVGQITFTPRYEESVFTDPSTDEDNINTGAVSPSTGGPTVYNLIIDNGELDNIYIPETWK